jgi:hypothetical protein
MPFWKSGRRFFEIHKAKCQPIAREHGVECKRSSAKSKGRYPRRPQSEISGGIAVLLPGIFGARSALHIHRSYDTVPYCARSSLLIRNRINQKFLSRFFSYLSGTYRMQTPTTEEARNTCGLRLPVWTGNDLAWLVPFHPDDLFFSAPSPRTGATESNAFDRCLEQLLRNDPNGLSPRLLRLAANVGAGRTRYGDLPRYPWQSDRTTACWASCAE